MPTRWTKLTAAMDRLCEFDREGPADPGHRRGGADDDRGLSVETESFAGHAVDEFVEAPDLIPSGALIERPRGDGAPVRGERGAGYQTHQDQDLESLHGSSWLVRFLHSGASFERDIFTGFFGITKGSFSHL